jgi:hypothetical protein
LRRDDPAAAMTTFEQLRNIPGDVGDAASLEFARRGDKTAADRLAVQLDPAPPNAVELGRRPPSRWPVHVDFLALLNNSARASGVPLIGYPSFEWWQTHRDRIVLHDPWLDEAPGEAR